MPVLPELAAALASGTVEVIDLTAPLSSSTPTLQLPPQFGQTAKFEFEEISNYDDARAGLVLEQPPHRGAHRHAFRRAVPLDHRQGRRGRRIRTAPAAGRAGGGAGLLRAGRGRPGLPAGGRAHPHLGARARPAARRRLAALPHWMGRPVAPARRLPERRREWPAHPGVSVDCARWLAEESPVVGLGVETVGTDAGAAAGFDPAFPCHT